MSVTLRPIRKEDLPLLTEWLNDPEVTATTIREFSNVTLEDERAWFARKTAPDCPDHAWGIEVDGRLIGTCELHVEEPGQTAFYGIIIGDKTAWNQGNGTTATREAVRIGFEELGYQRIWLQVGSHNPRGMRCYEKVGFRREGVMRRARLKRGQWIDVVMMAILREEWEETQFGLTPDVEWRNCLHALSPRPGEVIVDAGCGDGLRLLSIAARVAPSGRVLGLELNEERIQKATERIAARELQAIASVQRGDVRSLPLSDNSADAWFCRETLEYLDDPGLALAEAIRVVRPGGRVVAMEADWDTLAYHARDKAAERKFVAIHTDHGGGGSADGRTGRRLLSLFREAGLADVRLEAHVNWSDRYSPDDDYVCWPLREGHAHRGLITQEELEAWYADMSAQARQGRYFHCFSYFICAGRVR